MSTSRVHSDYPEKGPCFDLKLAAGGNKLKAAMIDMCFNVSEIQVRDALTQWLCLVAPRCYQAGSALWNRKPSLRGLNCSPVWLKPKPHSLSPEMHPKWWEAGVRVCLCLSRLVFELVSICLYWVYVQEQYILYLNIHVLYHRKCWISVTDHC